MKLKVIAMLAVTSLAALSCKAHGGAEAEPETPSGDSAGSGDSSSDSSGDSSSSSSGDPLTQGDSGEKDAYGRPKDADEPSSRGDDEDKAKDDKPKDVKASADKPKDDKGADKGAKVTKGIPMPVFPGLKFGMSLEQIAKLHDKDLDGEYKKKFLTASPTQTLAIEDELRDKKGVFRRSRIDFLDTPTGIDQSALKGEYSYGNKESLARLLARTRDDGKDLPSRNFFFFNDKLWKVYEEYKLGPKSNLGENFDQAVKKLAKVFGGEPQKVPADFQKGQPFDEAVWRDGEKVIRAIDRGDTLGMAFVDKNIQDNIAKYRTRTVQDQHELDKDVKAATANPPSQISGPPKDEKDKKDVKKK